MFGVASTVTGWFSGASKDEKKAIEMQQRQSQESNAAAQKLVDDRRQQYNQEGGPVPADVENQNGEVCMSFHFRIHSHLGCSGRTDPRR
jgi:hypothetical protein